MLSAIGSVPSGFASGSAPLASTRASDDAGQGAQAQPRPEPAIEPPAVILPRTAAWLSQPQPAAQPQSVPPPTSLLQTA